MEEDNVPNAWDFGPGNQDDGMSNGWSYGPGAAFDNGNTSDYGFNPNEVNLSNGPAENWGSYDTTMTPQEQSAAGQMPTTINWNPNSGGISQVLSDLFNNKRTMTGVGAFAEGIQNLFKANAMGKMTSQMQGRLDPFGKQRPFYQQQLQRSIQDPYSAPIVRDQVAQLQRMQAIKDAAAGRRSNGATSSPALLAAQAQIAQKYLDSLMTPAGANISPSGLSNLIAPQTAGINAGVNNFISPAITAMQRNNQEDLLQKLLKGG